EGEGLTACGHWTAITRWNRWRRVCVHCPAQHHLAVLDHNEPRTTVTGLAPYHARIEQPRQPDRAASGERRPQGEPLQRPLHELRGPDRHTTTRIVGIGFIDVAVSSTFSPEACAKPQQLCARREIDARQLSMRFVHARVTS